MKILHYINNMGSGGAERLLSFMLPMLKEKGHEVHLLYANDKKNIKEFEKLISDADVPIHNLNLSFYNPVHIWKIRSFIQKENFDVVHAHLFPTQYWLSLASRSLPKKIVYVKTEHNTHNNRREYKLLQPLDAFMYATYDHIISITEEVKNNLESWIDLKGRTSIIHNGVSLKSLREAQTNYNPEVYQFLSSEHVNILMVGRFDGDAKDQLSLVQSLSHLPEHFHVYFAGQGHFMDHVKKEVESLNLQDRVHFLGMRTDVYTLMHLVDLNVLSSNYEGLSGVALESLASGKPFIGSDVQGIKDIVPNSNFLFPPKNPEALAEKIKQVVNDETYCNDLITQAATHIEDFDIQKMVDAYEVLYVRLIGK